jgi:hypothetical protein
MICQGLNLKNWAFSADKSHKIQICENNEKSPLKSRKEVKFDNFLTLVKKVRKIVKIEKNIASKM